MSRERMETIRDGLEVTALVFHLLSIFIWSELSCPIENTTQFGKGGRQFLLQ